ncbi:MAG: hypothetical protein Q7Q71_08515 [Verrucomicrobiota bacterium JB023]|nr:hypothetical protein [Verrucomicrobiota bacterium JB023]
MFKRIIFDNWGETIFLSFGVTLTIFTVATIFALRMKKEKRDHLAHLPLADDTTDAQ